MLDHVDTQLDLLGRCQNTRLQLWSLAKSLAIRQFRLVRTQLANVAHQRLATTCQSKSKLDLQKDNRISKLCFLSIINCGFFFLTNNFSCTWESFYFFYFYCLID